MSSLPSTTRQSSLLPRLGLTVAAGLVLLAAPVAASAHVNLDASSSEAGSSTLLSFSFSHGCEGQATTALAFQVPEELVLLTPSAHPGWTIETTTEELDQPVDDGHGGEYAERTATITYTATEPVPDGVRDAVVLSTTLPADLDGQTLVFPVVQQCGSAESAWIQRAEDGQDPHDLDSPAPTLTVGEAAVDGHGEHGHGEDGHGEDGEVAGATSAPVSQDGGVGGADVTQSASTGGGVSPLAVGGLVLGLVGAVTGSLALARSRRG